jgi:hypothetical protein
MFVFALGCGQLGLSVTSCPAAEAFLPAAKGFPAKITPRTSTAKVNLPSYIEDEKNAITGDQIQTAKPKRYLAQIFHYACYVDEKGGLAIPPNYMAGTPFAENGLALVRGFGKARYASEGKFGFIDYLGHEIIPLMFDHGYPFSGNNLACVKFGGKYGFINERGVMVIPFRYDEAMPFSDNGLAPARENGK